jgi:very-short-patch-repair endonuclease
VFEAGAPLFRLDMAYPKSKVAVEYDGREFHEDAVRRERDRRRRKWLADHGWTVIVVTKDDFTAEAIDDWVQKVRIALRLAA